MPTITALDEIEGQPHANVFPDAEPKTIRLTLAAGERVPPHDHPGRDIILHLLEGAIELQLSGDTYDMTAVDIARFDGAQDISPHAIEDSKALIVLTAATDN